MPKELQKSLQEYLSKINKAHTPNLNSLLIGCKHRPKTLSFAIKCNDHREDGSSSGMNNTAATLVDVDRFLFENFRSLYLNDEPNGNKKNYKQEENYQTDLLFDSPRFIDPPPNIRGSNRFFIQRGGSSSLIEEARTSLTMSSCNDHATASISSTTNTTTTSTIVKSSTSSNDKHDRKIELPDDCIAVLKHSQSPYDDFRASMEEMTEARMEESGRIEWECLEELLFCYLNLNEKSSYKHILSAFVDLAVVFRQDSNRVPVRSRRMRWINNRKKKKKKNVNVK